MLCAVCEMTSEMQSAIDNSIHIRRNKILSTIQHFNTSAEDFTDFLFNISIDDFVDAMPMVRSSIQKFFSNTEEIDEGIEQLVKLFYARLEKNSEILEKYLEEVILAVPTTQQTEMSNSYTNKIPLLTQHQYEIVRLRNRLELQHKKKVAIAKQLQELEKLESAISDLAETVTRVSSVVNHEKLLSLLKEISAVATTVNTAKLVL